MNYNKQERLGGKKKKKKMLYWGRSKSVEDNFLTTPTVCIYSSIYPSFQCNIQHHPLYVCHMSFVSF